MGGGERKCDMGKSEEEHGEWSPKGGVVNKEKREKRRRRVF